MRLLPLHVKNHQTLKVAYFIWLLGRFCSFHKLRLPMGGDESLRSWMKRDALSAENELSTTTTKSKNHPILYCSRLSSQAKSTFFQDFVWYIKYPKSNFFFFFILLLVLRRNFFVILGVRFMKINDQIQIDFPHKECLCLFNSRH